MNDMIKRRTLFRHPLAALGGALFITGGFIFLILLLTDITTGTDNPYRSLVTFIGAPLIIAVGLALFILSIYLQVRRARRSGEKVKFNFYIDPTDPKYLRNLWLFLGMLGVLTFIVAYSGFKAYEATDSTGFCSDICHEVMDPQSITYQNSPHARVPCVECHIGPGASFYVKSKADGIRQVYATAFKTYSRPIETPVKSLRPAQQTCEGCHWPQQFYGKKLIVKSYYRTDEENSPWVIGLLMKIGGGNPRSGRQEGIHWHMLSENKIEYLAMDRKRQEIPWLRTINPQGDTTIYKDPDFEFPDSLTGDMELRHFDCMDCHNRPSHKFAPPASSLNFALSNREISPEMPFIRSVGLDLLNDEYPTRDDAHAAIRFGLNKYYEKNYPDFLKQNIGLVKQATEALIKIYDNGFFPEMNTDYRARENNLSHFVNNGCFRCHDNIKEDGNGDTLSHECNTCHSIIFQGPTEDPSKLESNINGFDFQHPEDIDEMWREYKCTECHTPESGY